MLLNGGRSATGEQIVKETSLQTMRRPVVTLNAEETDLFPAPAGGRSRELFGLGLYLQENFLGVDVVGHGGGVMGSTGYLAVVPERGLGVVLQTNGHGYPMHQLSLAALAHGLGFDLRATPLRPTRPAAEQTRGSLRLGSGIPSRRRSDVGATTSN